MSLKSFFLLILIFFSNVSWSQQRTGFGGVALNIMDPVVILSDFIDTACLVIGGSFVLASIIKFIEHRRSPLMVPISTVIFLFLAGLVLVLLPLVSYVTSNGIPYSLMK